ncbi:chemoreceptor-like protein with four helix bundle sensory module [Leeuwenhoekiella aestuarii]|uniref:Chemoreceptor-like protein with four helix bundle sensory module n=1 Tax=Leeuwenhoekiella aestuarii TaxID=2249426 RepID=A0A4V1KP93_9FLAO|nr:MCP four helix bundle domain-containing protein [Leeuwenhoekiella aestuarii]RXG14277.1 chemoreceptor-like protein with four helix bundle sensory module [Leeuwenhoekiella aestuarii]RXG19026.1 chemoreceptor-like protein with four helix bundle sensory module [Leeuwenhoekiella aestuarii]
MISNLPLSKRINKILALSVVFLLVLATNRIDQHHFETAQKSVNEVFEDRVLVQDYIFSISKMLAAKRLALKDSAISKKLLENNEEIAKLLSDFQNTKLTEKESNQLTVLQEGFEKIQVLESQIVQQSGNFERLKTENLNGLDTMQDALVALSKIQVHESKNLMHSAQKSLNTSKLISTLEIGFLIVIGIVIQITLFYRVKKSS